MDCHDNLIKFNVSFIGSSSTPQCSNSSLKGAIVNFQEYEAKKTIGQPLKKHLTIKIDESYDFQQSEENQEQTPLDYHNKLDSNAFLKSSSPINFGEIHREDIQQLKQTIQGLTMQLTVERQRNQHLQQVQQNLVEVKDLLKKNQNEQQRLKILLKKKQDMISFLQIRNQELTYEAAKIHELESQQHFYDERLREKEARIKDLQKQNDKLTIMNKSLQKELRDSDKKIMEFQKQMQKTFCHTQYQNLVKIKENSLKLKESSLKIGKENHQVGNNRKSLDKKKNSNSSYNRISANRGSSSATLINKKLLLKDKNNH